MYEIMTLEVSLFNRVMAEVAKQEYGNFLNVHSYASSCVHPFTKPLVVDNYVWCSMFGMSGMSFSNIISFDAQLLAVLYHLSNTTGYTNSAWENFYDEAYGHEMACSLTEIGEFIPANIISNEVERMLRHYECTDEQLERVRQAEGRDICFWMDHIFLAIDSSDCYEKAVELTCLVQGMMQETFKFTGLFIETGPDSDESPEEADFFMRDYDEKFESELIEYANPIRGGGFSCTS